MGKRSLELIMIEKMRWIIKSRSHLSKMPIVEELKAPSSLKTLLTVNPQPQRKLIKRNPVATP